MKISKLSNGAWRSVQAYLLAELKKQADLMMTTARVRKDT